MNNTATIYDAAQALAWALARGIVDARHAVAWADSLIIRQENNPMWLLDLSLARDDRNQAISQLNEVIDQCNFDMASGLFAALAFNTIENSRTPCLPILQSIAAVLRHKYDWGNGPDVIEELFVTELELEEGYGSEKDARMAIARYALPYRAEAVRAGLVTDKKRP